MRGLGAVLLTLALMLPTGVQFAHVFDGHEHVACNELKVHLHEDKIDCDLCDFQLSSFDYQVSEYSETHLVLISSEKDIFYTSFIGAEDNGSITLRGPPTAS